MAYQTVLGKAFEFATLQSLSDQVPLNNSKSEIIIEESSSYLIAKKSLNSLDEGMKTNMILGAEVAVKFLLRLEPFLLNSDRNDPLYLSIQEDSRGMAGDVRDILAKRNKISRTIGISCKHNHNAVKHSRLSQTIDFGNLWLGCSCSPEYFKKINPIFTELSRMREKRILWCDVDDKVERFYKPVLLSFMDEMNRLVHKYKETVPSQLILYLLGRTDFYKIMTNDANQTTRIQAFNLSGSLNKADDRIKPQIKIAQLIMPSKILEMDFKKDSNNTIYITCDGCWTVSFRIHSASSKVEPSLKFDIKLEGSPTNLYTHDEPWY